MPPVLPPGAPAISLPSKSPGIQSEALADIRNATKILEKALPKLGVESEEGKQVHRIIGQLAKLAPAADGNASIDAASLRNIRSQAEQAAPMQALMRSLSGAGQAPGGPQGAPPPEG